MVWGAFSSIGKLELQFISTKMDGHEYQEVLSKSLLPFLHRFHRLPLQFQQDNAGVHNSKHRKNKDPTFVPMKEWFVQHKIKVLEWPSCSPDMNPIENMWGMMVKHVYQDNRQYESANVLKEAISTCWKTFSNEILKKLVDSMQNRIFQLIQRSGGVTSY